MIILTAEDRRALESVHRGDILGVGRPRVPVLSGLKGMGLIEYWPLRLSKLGEEVLGYST